MNQKAIKEVRIGADGKTLHIHLDDKRKLSFHAIWLWQNDPKNYMVPSGQKIHSISSWKSSNFIESCSVERWRDLDDKMNLATKAGSIHSLNTFPSSSQISEDSEDMSYFIKIKWGSTHTCDSSENYELQSFFHLQWLYDWSCHHDNLNDTRLKREVTPDHTFMAKYRLACTNQDTSASLEREEHNGLLSFNYDDVMIGSDDTNFASNEKVLSFLDAIMLDGAAIVKNAPDTCNVEYPDEIVSDVGKMISGGSLSHGSLYGDTFHVKSIKNAINVAYTSENLPLHQDLAYYESKPGFQLLHCALMPSDIIGGESLLFDCMAAAHLLRILAPDLFETLVTCPATFVKEREGARMTYTRPHIILQADGSSLDDMNREIVAVHWAPAFEGPLRLSIDKMEKYHQAYSAFELMLDNTKCPKLCSKTTGLPLALTSKLSSYANEFTWEYKLKPGEILVFNNTRMLHGRRAFTQSNNAQGSNCRHLIGAYTHIDDSLNRYRCLLKQLGKSRDIPNLGNGSTSVLP